MDKVDKISGRLIPVSRNDVDTDQIIPARYLTSVSREGFAEGLFADLKKNDPEFSFNQEKFKGAKIMVAGVNFGCGSSREHAVWAIKGAGIEAVIAKSFADIFFSNSAKNGLLLIKADEKIVDQLLEASQSGKKEAQISLAEQKFSSAAGENVDFDYDSFRKHCLLNGLDDLDYILSQQDSVKSFAEKRSANLFYDTTKANN
jgi:3-isopropylmalate/(R)-2-methylmalate dehydratase small subunit